ncbi:alpha/beta fold hydrolase [Geodermatophilus sp. SYSU D00758]
MTQSTQRPTAADPAVPELVVPGPHRGIPERLAELARAVPDGPALQSEGRVLTWAGLDRRVRTLAAQMRPLLDGAGDGAVAVWAEQDADSAAAICAVTATGRPCVVLDVTVPVPRVAQVAERAGVTVVLADDARREAAAGLPGVTAVRGLVPAGPVPDGLLPAGPVPDGDGLGGSRSGTPDLLDTPALLLFTSGTTGVPKGVVFTHRTVLGSAYNHGRAFPIGPGDRVAVVMPTSFGAAMNVLFGALLNGATACVRDPRVHGLADLAGWLRRERVTVLCCTPSLLRALGGVLPPGSALPDLRVVPTGGEKVFGADVAVVRRHLGGHVAVLNWLGSSEGSGLAAYEVAPGDPVPEGVLPAGRPLPLQQLDVLGADGTPLPPGEPGVLAVTSAYLATGYWRDPVQTAERFTPLPDGRTRFRSGDRARLDADGVLHLLGRADDAVKIRGYLVEPAEVEATMRALPAVRDVVVRAVEDDAGTPRLAAWVEPDPAGGTASAALLRAGVARSLPAYMVPSAVVLLEQLPRTERGKVDVRALPPVPGRPEPEPPATADEAAVERIWAALLHLEAVGRHESFTALGADSLTVEEMLAQVTVQLGVRLTTADLAQQATLAEFAALVARGRRRRPGTDVVHLRSGGSRPPLFCFAGAGGAAAAFSGLAVALGPEQPVHAFQVHGLESRGVPDWTVGRAARRYLREIERLAPEGPVVLAGHSLGGLFALAVAHLLNERGREVREVLLLDTYLPLAARDPRAPVRVGPAAAPLAPRDLWRTRALVLTAGLLRHPPEVHKEVFHQHGARLGRFHRPRPWPGRARLVLSAENDDDPAWWARVLTGEHEVVRVDCGHNALLRSPYVERLAALLADDLARVAAG